MVKINLNIEKKHLLVLLIFLSLFTIALVIAVNPSTKPNPGHASNEVMVNIAGTDKTLQAAIDDGSFGGGKIGAPDFDSGWIDPPLANGRKKIDFMTDNLFGTGDITGKNPDKFLVSLKFNYTDSNTYGQGTTNFADGSSYGWSGYFYGVWYDQLTNKNLTLKGGHYLSDLRKVRIYIWSWE